MHRHIAFCAPVLTLFASVCTAQTCAAPSTWQPGVGPFATIAGDLCAGSDSVALYCSGLDSASKNDAIYQVTLANFGDPNRAFTSIVLNGAGAGFTPVMYLYSGPCATGDGCVASGDTANPIANDASIPAGTYFLAVTAAASDAANACGTYTLTSNGSLPVDLQSFRIE